MENNFVKLNMSETITNILAIQNQILQSGSCDSEKDALDGILKDLKQGKITPEKALELAKNLEGSRQNYH